MSAVVTQPEHESRRDLDAAEREHEEALAYWRFLERREDELRNGVRIQTSPGNWSREPPRWQPGEFEPEMRQLEEERAAAATRLSVARKRLRGAQLEAANSRLAPLTRKYEAAAQALEDELRGLEGAYAAAVAATWRVADAEATERQAASAMREAAIRVAPDEEARAELRRNRAAVPTRVAEDGPTEFLRRPVWELFDSHGAGSDPRTDDFWRVLGAFARAGRARGRHAVPEQVLRAVERAERGTNESR